MMVFLYDDPIQFIYLAFVTVCLFLIIYLHFSGYSDCMTLFKNQIEISQMKFEDKF